MKQKLRVEKITGGYRIYNADTGAHYRTIYSSKKSAETKKSIMLRWFLKR